MRESRTYGSVRGACDETHVPTATAARVHQLSGRRSGVAVRGARAAGRDADNRLSRQQVGGCGGGASAGISTGVPVGNPTQLAKRRESVDALA